MPDFYTVEKRNKRWCFITPGGAPFWSIGINHIDSATLRYAESEGVWEREFGNSHERWLRAVADDLRDWGFNTIGWTQEVVIITEGYHRHSRPFTYEEYQWADMPYCHLLPFTEAHQWQVEVRMPDLMSADFEEWCDYVARDECARLRDDPKLIGYFYCDCPQWVHTSPDTKWRGSLVDPELLQSDAGRRQLSAIAQRYYQVTHDAIRRYDPNHLILGDRWEANAALPEEVVHAALPYVDVLSFQCFGSVENIATKIRRWAGFADRPVLLADAAAHVCAHDDVGWPPSADRLQDTDHYGQVMEALWAIPQCVGYHLCGAYLKNNARKYGFRDRANNQINETVQGIRTVNTEMQRKIKAMAYTLDSYGGTTQLKGKNTGWFHLEKLDGRRWFITPEGNAFFPVSLAHIYTGNSQPTVQKLYDGDKDVWIEKWFSQVRALGFNCALAGATSQCRDPEGYVDVEKVEALFRRESFPYAAGLFLIPHPNELPQGQERPDIFSSAYQDWVEELVADVCSQYADDTLMMGYYYGFGTFIRPESWIESIPSLDSKAPVPENIRKMAVHLYRMVHDAIRRHDPNHLILGPYVKEQSFDLKTWETLTPYIDMLSPQHFNRNISFTEQSATTGRAVLVSDEESGHIFESARQNPHSVTSEHKGRVYSLLLDRHLRDSNVCGVNFCATLYDLDNGPLMDMMGMMEGLYDWDGNPKPDLVDVVRKANREIYQRAIEPYPIDELAELDEKLCRARDEVHQHVR